MYNLISGDYWRLSKLSTLRQVTWARSEPSRRPLPPFAEFTDQKKSGCNVSIPSLSKGSYQLSKEGPKKARNMPKTHPRSAPVPVLWAIIVEIIVNRPVKKKRAGFIGPVGAVDAGVLGNGRNGLEIFPISRKSTRVAASPASPPPRSVAVGRGRPLAQSEEAV